jgi:hypothetical protein
MITFLEFSGPYCGRVTAAGEAGRIMYLPRALQSICSLVAILTVVTMQRCLNPTRPIETTSDEALGSGVSGWPVRALGIPRKRYYCRYRKNPDQKDRSKNHQSPRTTKIGTAIAQACMCVQIAKNIELESLKSSGTFAVFRAKNAR